MIYVDQLRPIRPFGRGYFPAREACHLMADADDELDRFAAALGLQAHWRHGDHYDLTPRKRKAAIAAGARQIDARAAVALRRGRPPAK